MHPQFQGSSRSAKLHISERFDRAVQVDSLTVQLAVGVCVVYVCGVCVGGMWPKKTLSFQLRNMKWEGTTKEFQQLKWPERFWRGLPGIVRVQ